MTELIVATPVTDDEVETFYKSIISDEFLDMKNGGIRRALNAFLEKRKGKSYAEIEYAVTKKELERCAERIEREATASIKDGTARRIC